MRARLARPGRSVQLLEAVLTAAGREVAWARAWRVLRTDCPDAGGPGQAAAAARRWRAADPGGWVDGYLSAIEWRSAHGAFGEPGRPRVGQDARSPRAGREPAPLERVLAVADSGNGVSGELDLRHWLFINPELTVHLFREAAGEWICLDAQSNVAAGGTGLATSVLSDLDGPVGVGAQALLVAARPGHPG